MQLLDDFILEAFLTVWHQFFYIVFADDLLIVKLPPDSKVH